MSEDDDTAARRARADRLHAQIDRLTGRQPAEGGSPEVASQPAGSEGDQAEQEGQGESLRDLINERARELPSDDTPPEE